MSLSLRSLDHVVLAVEELDKARHYFSTLGFCVGPDARHVFGTENCCIYFQNGSFIEPLAIGHRETVEENARAGNIFLRRNLSYRFRNPLPGFSKLAFCGNDAEKDLELFRREGFRTDEVVKVERPGVEAWLACAVDERAPDCTLFTCQGKGGRPNPDPALTTHENGATGICRVVAVEENPSDFQYYAQFVSGQREVSSNSFGLELALGGCELALLTPTGLKMQYGTDYKPCERGLRLIAIDVAVEDLAQARQILESNSINHKQVGPRLVVTPDRAAGPIIAFIEKGD